MTVTEMQEYLASLVDDPQQTYFTPPQTLVFLNHAQQQTQDLLVRSGQNYFLKSATFATIVNGASYALPEDHLKTNRLEYVTGTIPNNFVSQLSSIPMNQKDYFAMYSQYPTNFYFFGRNAMILVPIPQSVCDMVHTYTYRIPALTLGSTLCQIPLEYQDYMVFLAAVQCFIKDQRDPSTLLQYTNQVESDLKRAAVERAQDHAPTVISTTNNDYWGW